MWFSTFIKNLFGKKTVRFLSKHSHVEIHSALKSYQKHIEIFVQHQIPILCLPDVHVEDPSPLGN